MPEKRVRMRREHQAHSRNRFIAENMYFVKFEEVNRR